MDLIGNTTDHLGVGKRSTCTCIQGWNAASGLGIETDRNYTGSTISTELACGPATGAARAATSTATATARTSVAKCISCGSGCSVHGSTGSLTALGRATGCVVNHVARDGLVKTWAASAADTNVV